MTAPKSFFGDLGAGGAAVELVDALSIRGPLPADAPPEWRGARRGGAGGEPARDLPAAVAAVVAQLAFR